MKLINILLSRLKFTEHCIESTSLNKLFSASSHCTNSIFKQHCRKYIFSKKKNLHKLRLSSFMIFCWKKFHIQYFAFFLLLKTLIKLESLEWMYKLMASYEILLTKITVVELPKCKTESQFLLSTTDSNCHTWCYLKL